MAEVWRVDIEDHTGNTVATVKNFQLLSFEQRVARRGSFQFQVHDDEPVRELIQEDYIARVWLKDEQYNLPWTNIFNGIIKTPSRVWYSNGNKLAIYYGSDDMELIDKALVMYPTSSTKSEKTGVASTVMGQYVQENIGASATTANGRFYDHVNPITVITPGVPTGPIWTGNKAHDSLTKALQDIRNFSYEQGDRVDFHSYYIGNYQWEIQIGKLFVDRTVNGLSPSTGLNGAGNVPVILSPLYGNVLQYTEATPRVQESNVVLVLGQRIGEDREAFVAADTTSLAISPIAQRESLSQTQNQENLDDFAESELNAKVGRNHILLSPKRTEAFALFRDINIGDFFTSVSLDGTQFNKQFVELKVKVQQTTGGRTISQYTLFTEDREPD